MNYFLITLAFIPALFGYPSQEQAGEACWEWLEKGVSHPYQYRNQYSGGLMDGTYYSRKCDLEGETRQFIGKESERIRRAKSWGMGRPNPNDWKIKKHFRY